VVCEMETGRTDFVGDWVSIDVAIRRRTTAFTHIHIFAAQAFHYNFTFCKTKFHTYIKGK
jgi:hypothetical protein